MITSLQAEMVQACIESLDHDEGREAFRNALEIQRDECKSTRDFKNAFRISQVLRRDNLFKAGYAQWLSSASTAFVSLKGEVTISELGDGELFKWFLEWFANGGWQVIIDFIKAIMPLFGLLGTP